MSLLPLDPHLPGAAPPDRRAALELRQRLHSARLPGLTAQHGQASVSTQPPCPQKRGKLTAHTPCSAIDSWPFQAPIGHRTQIC